MLKQIGKVGAIHRKVQGAACTSCGGHTIRLSFDHPSPSKTPNFLHDALNASSPGESMTTSGKFSGCNRRP